MTYEYNPQAHAEAIIEDKIRTEIALGIEQAGSVRVYINNFAQNLDIGGSYRPQIEQAGWTDRAMVDSRYEPGDEENRHSALAYTKTWGQFFTDVDRAVAESGLDPAELARLQTLADEPSPARDSGQAQEARDRYVLPAYRLLRIWGYSPFELRR